MRIAVAAGGVKAQGRHTIGLCRIDRFAFDGQIIELAVFSHKTDVGKLRIGAGIGLHLRHGGQILGHFLTAHIDIDQHVAEGLHLHHIFIGDITRFNRITHSAAAHHREISIAARHLRRQQQTSHIGLHETNFAAIALQMRVYATDFHL